MVNSRGYLLFVCRPKRGMLSSFPAELEITASVEVTDCFSRMFITSPRPNDQPLCHAVLVSLKLNVKMSSEGKQGYSSYFNFREKLETRAPNEDIVQNHLNIALLNVF